MVKEERMTSDKQRLERESRDVCGATLQAEGTTTQRTSGGGLCRVRKRWEVVHAAGTEEAIVLQAKCPWSRWFRPFRALVHC